MLRDRFADDGLCQPLDLGVHAGCRRSQYRRDLWVGKYVGELRRIG
jgi:hypothetical protein